MNHVEVDASELPVEKIAYSYNEAAAATGYSTSHIRRMVYAGYIVAVRPRGSSKTAILAESLREWVTTDSSS